MLRIDKNKKILRGISSQPDICEGPLVKSIILYTLPIMATGVLQLLFNAADSIIVGRYSGNGALAAVGATGALVTLIINLLIGISVGTSVNIAHTWGAGDKKGVSEVVHTSILTAILGGILVGAFGFFFSRGCLGLMSTPDDIIDQATLYMKIYFIGLPALMVYNFSASIMRSTGDTKHPLYFLVVGGVANVVLNLIFVIGFGRGVDGVAIATVTSEVISAIMSVVHLARVDGPQRLSLKKLRIHKARFIKIMIIGIPAGLQGTVFSLSNVIIQSSINSFGSVFVTGNSAGSSIEGFIYIATNAFYHTVLTFVGQHVGARKPERIKKVVRLCLAFSALTGTVLGLLVIIFRNPLLKIYIPNDAEAVAYGAQRLIIICSLYALCGIMDTLNGCLRGLGASLSPMLISTGMVCGTRMLWIATVFKAYHTPFVLFLAYPLSWLLTVIAQLICYFIVKKRLFRKLATAPDLT